MTNQLDGDDFTAAELRIKVGAVQTTVVGVKRTAPELVLFGRAAEARLVMTGVLI